tara:strand:- start:1916 stop:2497 length:582 start_codon:yes stop_codon:yes gene_type:complete
MVPHRSIFNGRFLNDGYNFNAIRPPSPRRFEHPPDSVRWHRRAILDLQSRLNSKIQHLDQYHDVTRWWLLGDYGLLYEAVRSDWNGLRLQAAACVVRLQVRLQRRVELELEWHHHICHGRSVRNCEGHVHRRGCVHRRNCHYAKIHSLTNFEIIDCCFARGRDLVCNQGEHRALRHWTAGTNASAHAAPVCCC